MCNGLCISYKLASICVLMIGYKVIKYGSWFHNGVQINNNLRCYDLAMELSNSTLEALPQNYAEQVMPNPAWFFLFSLLFLAFNLCCLKFTVPRAPKHFSNILLN